MGKQAVLFPTSCRGSWLFHSSAMGRSDGIAAGCGILIPRASGLQPVKHTEFPCSCWKGAREKGAAALSAGRGDPECGVSKPIFQEPGPNIGVMEKCVIDGTSAFAPAKGSRHAPERREPPPLQHAGLPRRWLVERTLA